MSPSPLSAYEFGGHDNNGHLKDPGERRVVIEDCTVWLVWENGYRLEADAYWSTHEYEIQAAWTEIAVSNTSTQAQRRNALKRLKEIWEAEKREEDRWS